MPDVVKDVAPVPPYRMPMDVVAPTTPLFAWSGPFRDPASVSTPAVEKLEVAEDPNAQFPRHESAVVDALANVCSAVQLLALPMFKESVPAAPPTSAPNVPEYASEPPIVDEVVATFCKAPVPAPYTRFPEVNDVWPVPPFATVSAEARVKTPSVPKVEVAVAPKYAGPRTESSVDDACPSHTFCVVVGARKPVKPFPPISHAWPKLDVESVPHERTPAVLAFTSQTEELRVETMSADVDAVFVTEKKVDVAPLTPTLKIVVVAEGDEEATAKSVSV